MYISGIVIFFQSLKPNFILKKNFIIIPMANFGLAIAESNITISLIDTSTMMPVLMGMLGLGAMRSVEKVQGVSREK